MSTVKVINVVHPSSATNNIVLDSSGNASVGGTMAMSSSFMRNRIINGAMVVDQRNAGAAVTVNTNGAFFPVDRFYGQGQNTDGVYTLQQVSDGPSGFTKSLKATVTTADASLGATQYYNLNQTIEGFNCADLGWGTASAQTITLSFWVKSSVTGTFSGAFNNSANNRSYPFTYAISAANTWEQKTVVVPGDTTGTWLTDNGVGIKIFWSFGTGSTYSGTAGAWAAALYIAATGGTNLMATNGATWQMTGVQLEVGSVATPFEREIYSETLAKCQRYYEIGNLWQLYSGYVVSGDVYYNPVRFSVTKRAGSTVTPTVIAVSRFPSSITAPSVYVDGFYAQSTANVTGTGYYQYSWTASAEL